MPLLEIEKLSLSIGRVPILKSIDLTIGAGETMGLVGESGSGKSMTALTLMQLLPNAAKATGRVTFDGIDILAEAGLSYVGLGAQPPAPSWGRMLFDAQTRMMVAPHLALFPGFAIVVTVLGLNLLGDGLRDLLDPRLRRER